MLTLALLAAVTTLGDGVDLRVRAGAAGAVTCTARCPPGAPACGLTPTGPGRWQWRRPAGALLSCSSPGYEPLDLDPARAAVPAALTLEMNPGRRLTLETGWRGIETVIEWRAPGEQATALLASQTTAMGARLSLPVASAPRVIRLRPAGLSPVSLLIPEDPGPLRLSVPRPGAGGEVFGTLPGHAFVPETLELGGPRGKRTLRPGLARVFAAAGLEPGRYTLTPVYRGGVRGAAQAVAVRAGQTAELLPLSLPEPGAVSVRTAAEICRRELLPARLSLHRVKDEGRVVDPHPLVAQAVDDAPCDREWEGLEEGTYQVTLTRAGEPAEVLSSARFPARRGQRAQATLTLGAVRVVGRLTYGADRPAAGLTVAFELDAQEWRTETDASGEYAVALGAPGAYAVSVRASRGLPSHSEVRTFGAGEQRLDVKLGEGALTLRLTRQEPGPLDEVEVVQVALLSGRGRRLTGSASPEDEGLGRFVGLEFDEYWVTARTPSGLTSVASVRVELSAEQPAGEAEVVLGRHHGRLRVVDERGAPLAGAQVQAGGVSLRELSPGLFPLDGVPAGEWLRVKATGHAPVCRVLHSQELPEVKAALPLSSDTLRIHFASNVAWETGLLLGLPGSDCPVEVADVATVASLGDNRTTVLLRVPRGQYRLTLGSDSYSLVVPGQDVHIN